MDRRFLGRRMYLSTRSFPQRRRLRAAACRIRHGRNGSRASPSFARRQDSFELVASRVSRHRFATPRGTAGDRRQHREPRVAGVPALSGVAVVHRCVAMREPSTVASATRAAPRHLAWSDDDSRALNRASTASASIEHSRGALVSRIAASSMTNRDQSWVCCQLGARDHYIVPRALQRIGLLRELITDLWIRPGSVRFHSDLSSTRITALNIRALSFELKTRISGATGWNLISKRNDWFQGLVAQLTQRQQNGEKLNVFAYSYAAEGIFNVARERGWRTVLGQIDPGPAEERIVAKLESNGHSSAPPEYWRRWRNECELADQIIVN